MKLTIYCEIERRRYLIINIIKDRVLEGNQQVNVYRNLNKGKVFSIKDKKTGLVVAHADRVLIKDVTFKVSEAGRQRVIRDQRKNVHASCYGTFVGECEVDVSAMTEVTYNPYKLGSFIVKETGEEIHSVDQVYFEDGKSFI